MIEKSYVVVSGLTKQGNGIMNGDIANYELYCGFCSQKCEGGVYFESFSMVCKYKFIDYQRTTMKEITGLR